MMLPLNRCRVGLFALLVALVLPPLAVATEGSGGGVVWEKGAFGSSAAARATNGPAPLAPAPAAPALPEGSGVVLDTARVTVRVRVEQ